MALQTESALQTAWRALVDGDSAIGWRTIGLNNAGPCRVLAARHKPDNMESILVGFTGVRLPAAAYLPEGTGFTVTRVEPGAVVERRTWLALARLESGNLDIFTRMVDDVLATLDRLHGVTEARVLDVLLARVRAWQAFMLRPQARVLSGEEEVGLFGELDVLSAIVAAGVPSAIAVDGWIGPLDGVQDFAFGAGAIEVKTTLAAVGFPAKIGSLDQLDDAEVSPLYLAAVRLELADLGRTLPEMVEAVQAQLTPDPAAVAMFEARIRHLGLDDADRLEYTRCFSVVERRFFRVTEEFPRLTRSSTDPRITKGRYEINVDTVATATLELAKVLGTLGVF